MGLTASDQNKWMAQWRAAGDALQQLKLAELAQLGEDQARQMTGYLLELAAGVPISPQRWSYSGLIDQQRLFHGRQSE